MCSDTFVYNTIHPGKSRKKHGSWFYTVFSSMMTTDKCNNIAMKSLMGCESDSSDSIPLCHCYSWKVEHQYWHCLTAAPKVFGHLSHI